MAEQKGSSKSSAAQTQREIKALNKGAASARRSAMAEMAVSLLVLPKKVEAFLLGGTGRLGTPPPKKAPRHRREAIELIGEANAAGARLVKSRLR